MVRQKKEPQYNWVYKKLTEDGQANTVLNYIAYAFYKQDKILEIEAFKNTNGHYPDDDELAPFRERSQSETKLKDYREKAEAMLQNYTDSVDEAIVRDAVKDTLDKNNHGFWYGVGQSIVASFAFAILCYIVFLLVKNGVVSIPGITIAG